LSGNRPLGHPEPSYRERRLSRTRPEGVLFSLRAEGCLWSSDVPMDRTTDLETALGFVVRRIEEQAKASGHPLNEKEHSLLENLPPSNVNYSICAPDLGPAELVPRNINLERLCALAKAAYLSDCEANPASLDWEFSFAVFTLKRHPMWGILHSAGVRIYQRSSRDGLLMTIAALLPLIAAILLVWSRLRSLFYSAAILCGCVAIMLFIYFASQQIEQRHLENHIERCRLASRNISWKTS
jgi:hypothetical protein